MAIIYSYPTKDPVASSDTLIVTDSEDNSTKTVTIGAIADFVDDQVDLEEVLAKGNTATNDIILTGDYSGTGNMDISADFDLGGNMTLSKVTSQLISKTTGELQLYALAGNLDIRAVGVGNALGLRADLGGIQMVSASSSVEITSGLGFTTFSQGKTTIEADDDVKLISSNTGSIQLVGGSGAGNGFYPANTTDLWAFNGEVRFNQLIRDKNGVVGGAGQYLGSILGGQVEWNTLYGQDLTVNEVYSGNALGKPAATNLLTLNQTTNDVTIGVSTSNIEILGSVQMPATGATLDMQESKIIFNNDAANTFIAADTNVPENLQIHADNQINLLPDSYLVYDSPVSVPATNTDAADKGSIAYDDDHIYIAIQDDLWKRVALSTF